MVERNVEIRITGYDNGSNSIHEKITQFWLAEKGVQNV